MNRLAPIVTPCRIVAAALWLGASAVAAGASGPAGLCEGAAAEGAAAAGVPVEVLSAIALTETGRVSDGRFRPWPWAVNREGEGFWFDTREEALAFARESLAAGRPSFDMGCFQINYRWHGQNFASLEAMVDPSQGAVYAARFLRGLRDELGSWEAAAGAYHSRTPELAARYRGRFERILARLGGAPSVGVAQAEPASVAAPRKVRRVRAPLVITLPHPDAADERAASLHDVEVIIVAGRR